MKNLICLGSILVICVVTFVGCSSSPASSAQQTRARVSENASRAHSRLTTTASNDGGYSYYHEQRESSRYSHRISDGGRREMYPEYIDGYQMDRAVAMKMRTLAGLYAGTVRISREMTPNGTKINCEGYYSQAQNPQAMEKVLSMADENGDKGISLEEARDITEKVYREFLSE